MKEINNFAIILKTKFGKPDEKINANLFFP